MPRTNPTRFLGMLSMEEKVLCFAEDSIIKLHRKINSIGMVTKTPVILRIFFFINYVEVLNKGS